MIELASITASNLYHFGFDFGTTFGSILEALGFNAAELVFSVFGILLVLFLVLKRLGAPARNDFGPILPSFWDRFRFV